MGTRFGTRVRPVAGLVALAVISLAAACSPEGVQSVRTDGRAAVAPVQAEGSASTSTTGLSTTTSPPATTGPSSTEGPTSTTNPPTSAVPVVDLPATTTTLPPVDAMARRPPTTTTTRHRSTTTTIPKAPPASIGRAVAYAAAEGTRPDYGVVVPITALGTAGTPIHVGGVPNGIVATPDGTSVLVANAEGYVSVIDTLTNTRRYDIPVCISAFGIAVTPDGNSAWVTCQQGSVQPVDLLRRQAGSPIPVGYLPYTIVITSNGTTAYVLNYNGTSPGDPEPTIVPIDIVTRTPGAPIGIGNREGGAAALSPDGRTLYAVAGNGCCASSIAQIDTATNKVIRTFPTKCTGARSMAVTAGGATGYLGCLNGVTTVTLDHFTEPAPNAPGLVKGVALTTDGKTLYAADWAAGVVVFIDVATMQPCGSVKAEMATAVAVVPGIVPNARCTITSAP